MIIDEYQIFLMDKHYEFRNKIAYRMGLRPVFKIIDIYRDATMHFVEGTVTINGKDVPVTEIEVIPASDDLPSYPDSKEIEDYLQEENIWIAGEVLKHYNWSAFVQYCNLNDVDHIIKNYTPCMGVDKQCQMDCANYFNCNKDIKF